MFARKGRPRARSDGHYTCLAQTRKSFEGRFLVHEVAAGDMTLAQFAKDNWTGSFYVSVRVGGHRFDLRNRRSHKVAVVNGVIVDNLSKSWLRGRHDSVGIRTSPGAQSFVAACVHVWDRRAVS